MHVEITPNDFRLGPSDLPWMNLAWKLLPDWYSSQKLPIYGQTRDHYFGCSHERKWEANWTWKDDPVRRAFRTTGLVRGKQPYILIVDDIQKGDAEHLYEFLLHVPDDIEMESAVVYFQDKDPVSGKPVVRKANSYLNPGTLDVTGEPIACADIVLKEPDLPQASGKYGLPGGDRRLLVRILRCEGDLRDDGRPAKLETYVRLARWQGLGKRLVIPSRSIAPNYKILLYPHRKGQPMPVTVWNPDRTQVTIAIGDQKDVVDFAVTESGRTEVRISRNGEDIVRMD
jgi:hypothetical protein